MLAEAFDEIVKFAPDFRQTIEGSGDEKMSPQPGTSHGRCKQLQAVRKVRARNGSQNQDHAPSGTEKIPITRTDHGEETWRCGTRMRSITIPNEVWVKN